MTPSQYQELQRQADVIDEHKKNSMEFNFELEVWTISKLLNKLEESKFVKLPHQRPLTLKKNSSKRFIESALKKDLLVPFTFADIQSSFSCSIGHDDMTFFRKYLNKGYELSIEDCQHRMASLESVTDDDFVGEFEGKKEEFLNTKVIILILKCATKDELIRKFGRVNSGKTVTNDNLIWGENNSFNDYIKERFINDDRLLRLYKTKKKSESIERILYGNVLKIIKVCSSHDDIINSSSTGADQMMSFVKDNMDITHFQDIVGLFDMWYEYVKDNPTKDSFTTQSNLFFILHILNKKELDMSEDKVNNILVRFTDSRSRSESRYIEILNTIENEE
jgi:hypothetical protein